MERPELAFITLIEAPHPQELNYLAGKEAPSSVLINYLWRYNYSEYGKKTGRRFVYKRYYRSKSKSKAVLRVNYGDGWTVVL